MHVNLSANHLDDKAVRDLSRYYHLPNTLLF